MFIKAALYGKSDVCKITYAKTTLVVIVTMLAMLAQSVNQFGLLLSLMNFLTFAVPQRG